MEIEKNCLFQCSKNNYHELLNANTNFQCKTYRLNGKIFAKNSLIEEVDAVTCFLRKQWILMQNLALLDENTNYDVIKTARTCLNDGLQAVLEKIHENSEHSSELLNAVNSISVSVITLNSFDEKAVIKLCNIVRDKIQCPLFEYFHAFLEIQLFFLKIYHKCDMLNNGFINDLMSDFVLTSRKLFLKEANVSLKPFLCPCLENFWIILMKTLKEKFWYEFEIVLKNDNDLFSLWLINHLINISPTPRTLPDNSLIRNTLKNLLNNSEDNNNILNLLKVISGLLYELNIENRVETVLLLWEYFSKRLSSEKKTVSKLNCIDFIESLNSIVFAPNDCNEDYDYFIGLLINYLKKHANHWSKIKCRIFSQLNPFKVGNLGENGIYKVSKLFISLMQINQEELSGKLISIFEQLKDDQITMTHVNIYISILIFHVQKNESVEKFCSTLVKILQKSSENQNFPLVKEFFSGFEQILKASSSLNLHQWELFDTWIIRYMSTCYFQDLEHCLDVLLQIVAKLKLEDSYLNWEQIFVKYVYPVLKQIGNTTSCPVRVGELMGEIFNLTPQLRNESFVFFNGENINSQVIESFLCTILKDYPEHFVLTSIQEKIAFRSWIRICLFSTKNFREVTLNILKLKAVIPDFIDRKPLKNSKDPYVSFVEILGLNKNILINNTQNINKFPENCYDKLDEYLAFFLPQTKNEIVILRVFTCLALTFLNCGILLYDRHKISSPLTKLISCLLFPPEFLSGKTTHQFPGTVKKTWHIFFEALSKLDLDNNDSYIQRTLRDLISKYIPLYSVSESPIFSCLTRENSAKSILDKLATIYFKHPTKENENNVMKALKIVKEFLESNTSSSLFQIVVDQTLYGLCEVYIFHTQKSLGLTIIMGILTSNFYETCKENVIRTLVMITEKHIAFNSKSYFSLINLLAKTVPSEIVVLKDKIVEKIKEIERIRGIGYDNNLRNYLSALNDTLNK